MNSPAMDGFGAACTKVFGKMEKPVINCKRCGAKRHDPCPDCGKCLCVGDWPWCPHEATTRQRVQLEPIVVFRRPDGRMVFPGSNRDKTPKGCERIVLDTLPAMEKFERQYNETLRRESSDKRAFHDAAFAEGMKARRSELRQAMSRMHPLARAIAEAAMKKTDEGLSRRTNGEFRSYFPVLHYDSSNLEPHRDAATDWKERRA